MLVCVRPNNLLIFLLTHIRNIWPKVNIKKEILKPPVQSWIFSVEAVLPGAFVCQFYVCINTCFLIGKLYLSLVPFWLSILYLFSAIVLSNKL